MTKKNVQWTEIDTDVSDDTNEGLQLNLNEDVTEFTKSSHEFTEEESKDTRRGILTVSKGANEQKAPKEDDQTRTEVEEDQDEGTSGQEQTRVIGDDTEKKGGRAHKRIKTLIGRLSEKDRYIEQLENAVRQTTSQSRVAQKNSVVLQKDQWKEIIDAKKQALEEAVDKANGKDVARLTQEVAEATMKYQAFQAVAEDFDEEPDEPQQRTQQRAPDVPEAAREWASRNPWFKTDPKKQVLARMISNDLTQEGELDPHDDDYWEELDKRLGEFTGKQGKTQEEPEKRPQRGRGSPVGSRNDEDAQSNSRIAGQFTRSGNKVSATPSDSDKNMAESLGVKIGDYMKEKYKYAQQDFKGYVTIDIPGQT